MKAVWRTVLGILTSHIRRWCFSWPRGLGSTEVPFYRAPSRLRGLTDVPPMRLPYARCWRFHRFGHTTTHAAHAPCK